MISHDSRARLLPAAALAALLALAAAPGAARGAVVHVWKDATGAATGADRENAFLTIAAAQAAAQPGDTIRVWKSLAPYRELIVITAAKPLNFLGDPGATTGAGRIGPGPEAPALDGTGFWNQPAFKIGAGVNDISISGFFVRNYGPFPSVSQAACGVQVNSGANSGISITDNHFETLGWDGVVFWSNGATGCQNLTVARNFIYNFFAYGIEFTNVTDSVIEENEIVAGPEYYGIGILLSAWASAGAGGLERVAARGNRISTVDNSMGIFCYGYALNHNTTLAGVLLENNDLQTHALSINFWEVGGAGQVASRDHTVRGNRIKVTDPQSNPYGGAVMRFQQVGGVLRVEENRVDVLGAQSTQYFDTIHILGERTGDALLLNNTFNNHAVSANNAGLYLESCAADSTLQVIGNDFLNYGYALYFENGVPAGASPRARSNNLLGSLAGGVVNSSPETVQAARNWWGDPAGPSGTNGVTGDVEFAPPLAHLALQDGDRDGLRDSDEILVWLTDPGAADSDGDGIGDGVEARLGFDPLDPDDPAPGGMAAAPDTDGDGLRDPLETLYTATRPDRADSDGDRVSDGFEFAWGANPNSAANRPPLGDINGNGRVDNIDAVMIFQMSLGALNLHDFLHQKDWLDVNGDSALNFQDAIAAFDLFLAVRPWIP